MTLFSCIRTPGSEETSLGKISCVGLETIDGLETVLRQGPPKSLAVRMSKGFRTGFKVCYRCSFHRGTGIEYGHPIRKFKGLIDIMGNENHSLALVS